MRGLHSIDVSLHIDSGPGLYRHDSDATIRGVIFHAIWIPRECYTRVTPSYTHMSIAALVAQE